MSELAASESTGQGWLRYRRPAASYGLNADFEDHAEHEYMSFIAGRPELETQPWDCPDAAGYGHFASIADLIRQIGCDEHQHKQESLAQPRLR